TPSELHFRWWRGQDLNLRPSGYEPPESGGRWSALVRLRPCWCRSAAFSASGRPASSGSVRRGSFDKLFDTFGAERSASTSSTKNRMNSFRSSTSSVVMNDQASSPSTQEPIERPGTPIAASCRYSSDSVSSPQTHTTSDGRCG